MNDTSHDTMAEAGEQFERRPVPESRLLRFKSFLGMYAGEHTAGTELMIGPLFVAAGVGAFDVLGGLFLGTTKTILLAATLLWFGTAPFWMKKD